MVQEVLVFKDQVVQKILGAAGPGAPGPSVLGGIRFFGYVPLVPR